MTKTESRLKAIPLELIIIVLLILQMFLLGLLLYRVYSIEKLFFNTDSQSSKASSLKTIDDIDIGILPPLGNPNAKVKLIAFLDFQCPHCTGTPEFFNDLLSTYDGNIAIYTRNLPLSFHPFALDAAKAANCANLQGKYWDYHNVLFEHQKELNGESFTAIAAMLKLDKEKFSNCMDSYEVEKEIQQDIKEANTHQISSTPSIIVGNKLVSRLDKKAIIELIDSELQN